MTPKKGGIRMSVNQAPKIQSNRIPSRAAARVCAFSPAHTSTQARSLRPHFRVRSHSSHAHLEKRILSQVLISHPKKPGLPAGKVKKWKMFWVLAAVWVGLAFIAILIAIWFQISTALSEIVVGAVAQLRNWVESVMAHLQSSLDYSRNSIEAAGAGNLRAIAAVKISKSLRRPQKSGNFDHVPA
jgi:hypothetical protein